ncbi:MAG: 2OG-Fe(II) oxygenase [Burkholderiaceae bacterium]|nr:2OG-Fe(II) oxygenase [Burkholderiaceae bacterium]
MRTGITPQNVTPQLRQWIIDQAEAGCSAESVLEAMKAAGWNEDVAVTAMEETLGAHLQAKGLSPQDLLVQAAQAQGETAPRVTRVVVPEPDLVRSPLYLDGGDRRVAVLSVLAHPRVVVLGGLLDDAECQALIEAARPRLARSLTVQVDTGGEEVNADRTSEGMFFARGESELLQRIEARIARLVNWPVENGEGIQVLHYGQGAEYRPHYDYFEPDAAGTPTILKRGGQRVATVVMYLDEPAAGGGTVFPDARLEVAPRRGNAVFFSYDRPHPSTLTLHGGAPVIEGEKWIATKWLREREFV